MSAYPLTLFHDGNCPICRAEVAMLQARDSRRQLRFVDIAADDFDPAVTGRTRDVLQAQLHALRADGQMVTGVESFRLAYRAVGLDRIVAPLVWPPLRPLTDRLYGLFARHRHTLSRTLGWAFDGFAARQAHRRSAACHGRCAIPGTDDGGRRS